MIGRLLQTAASTFNTGTLRHQQHQQQSPLESVTEEAHTRDLLFPDPAALRASFHGELPLASGRPATARDAANYDDRGGLDIAYPTDIRLIIAQDANSRHHQPQVLYDSRPPRAQDSSRTNSPLQDHQEPAGSQRLAVRQKAVTSPNPATAAAAASSSARLHQRTPSSSIFPSPQLLPLSPTSPRSPEKVRGLFGDSRARTSPFDYGYGENETAQGKLAREAKEETDALLGCMFGAPGFRLEPGTKLHVLPRKAPDANGGKKSPNVSRPISSGGFARKRTPLVRSTSAADISVGRTSSVYSDGSDQAAAVATRSKPSIMFTRLFNVNLPETTSTDSGDEQHGTVDAASPPAMSNSPRMDNKAKAKTVKQKKVPMYAIAVILQVPTEATTHRLRASPSQQGLSSLGSSLNDSTPANSWRAEQSAFSSFMELRSQGSFDSVLNSHISHVLQHWSVVGRALELLEATAKAKLLALLEQATPPAPLILTPTPKSGTTTKTKKPKPPTQQSVYVNVDCLQGDSLIKDMADAAAQRIVTGLRIRRVVVGQGRWGAWREEARWVGRWAGGREQNFFFFNFLTAFLGSHTEWLELLGPWWYRRRHAQQQQQRTHGKGGSTLIHHRTVIVSSDKMAARRLIFLLAAFLPSHFNHVYAPPSLLQQNHALSESPPSSSIPLRDQQSLRRSATQRSGRRNGPDGSAHARSVSFSLAETANEGSGSDFESTTGAGHNRRSSDVRSLKSPSLAIPTRASESRKASMSTVIADSAQAVPHFSSLSAGESSTTINVEKRPGSGGSMASLALSHQLKRSDSANTSSGSGGRWGSMVSGFWSNRRDSSTDDGDVFAPSSQESPARSRTTNAENRRSISSISGLERMVEEVAGLQQGGHSPTGGIGLTPPRHDLYGDRARRGPRQSPYALQLSESDATKAARLAAAEAGPSPTSSPGMRIPQRTKPEKIPLKLSFNENEGYIDIAMPNESAVAGSFSSLASSFASIRLPPTLASPLGDHHGHGYGHSQNQHPQHHQNHNHHHHHHNSHFSPYGSIASDSSLNPVASSRAEPTVDVAGWLRAFHPDFSLQAVRPYEALRDDVAAAMRAEVQLSQSAVNDFSGENTASNAAGFKGAALMSNGHGHDNDRWTDMCETLIADTTRFTVERLKLRRRRKRAPQKQQPQQTSKNHHRSFSSSCLYLSEQAQAYETSLVAETVMDMDATLIDAVERVLAQSGHSSRAASRAASPQRTGSGSIRSGGGKVLSSANRVAAGGGGGGSTSSGANNVNNDTSSSVRVSAAALEQQPQSVSKPSNSKNNTNNNTNTLDDDNPSYSQQHTPTPAAPIISTATSTSTSSQPPPAPPPPILIQEVPHSECRKTILDALEEVVRSVVEEKQEEEEEDFTYKYHDHNHLNDNGEREQQPDGGEDGYRQQRKKGRATATRKKGAGEADSTLKEGVRRWLSGVEEGW